MVASYIVELDAVVVEIVQDCNTVFVSFSVIRLGSSCSENEEFFESSFNKKNDDFSLRMLFTKSYVSKGQNQWRG